MTTIFDRCAGLQARVAQYRDVQANRDKADILRERHRELLHRREQLADQVAVTRVLRQQEHLASSQLPQADKALESCTSMVERLDADPESITRGRSYTTLLSRLDKVVSELRSINETSWSEVVKRYRGGDEGFLRQVEQVPGQEQAVAAIREAREALEEFAESPPRISEHYEQFLQRSDELQAALSSLYPEDFPSEVLAFFKEAQGLDGAPLALLTDSVQEWLRSRDMLTGIRVRYDGGR